MRAQLFVPCLVEDCQPEAAEDAAYVLERLGLEVGHPPGQTCCGQLAYKTGDLNNARLLALRYLDVFSAPGPVVGLSGSCVKMVRSYPDLFPEGSAERVRALDLAARTFEFCGFVLEHGGFESLAPHFKVRACLHASCQVAQLGDFAADAPRALLSLVRGLTLVQPERPDRCCGFGGLFSLQFPGVSEALLEDKCEEILALGADILVSAEPSCLMNISGYLARLGRSLPALHAAQVLAAALRKTTPSWRPPA